MCDLPRGLPPRASGSGARDSKVGSDDSAYLWYCPLTEELSVHPPELTPVGQWHRGGFLCEEMGMGKTLITLALILANPAPPLTSRQAKMLTDPTLARFLKGDLTQKEVEADKWTLGAEKVPSRSTLVVCAVSLVDQVRCSFLLFVMYSFVCSYTVHVVCALFFCLLDQWVSEATGRTQGGKALSIYKYYGPQRERDPQKLASRADIVVTTYQILGSDVRGNSKAIGAWQNPCAAIDWHRIVLDESHGKAATNSVTSLSGQRRWCVTGTPFCTKVEDVQPQLQFLRGCPFAKKTMFDSKVRS
jgi:SNF2 family DNA or RNA helicase